MDLEFQIVLFDALHAWRELCRKRYQPSDSLDALVLLQHDRACNLPGRAAIIAAHRESAKVA